MLKLVSSFIAVIAIGTGLLITYILHKVPERPNYDLEKWWGMGTKPKEQDTAIRIFSIDFNDTVSNIIFINIKIDERARRR